jgi:hypothetical protein
MTKWHRFPELGHQQYFRLRPDGDDMLTGLIPLLMWPRSLVAINRITDKSSQPYIQLGKFVRRPYPLLNHEFVFHGIEHRD